MTIVLCLTSKVMRFKCFFNDFDLVFSVEHKTGFIKTKQKNVPLAVATEYGIKKKKKKETKNTFLL